MNSGVDPSDNKFLAIRRLACSCPEERKKVNCTLRLSKTSLDWWKSLGDGHTAAMSRMLEEARNYPDLLKRII